MISSAKRIVKRLVCPLRQRWATRRKLAGNLRNLGVRPGGALLVHSSLSSLGYVPGGADAVLDALLDALGPEGTLVLPTHSFDLMNAGCRRFDMRETPSCVGRLTEVFRKRPLAVRSLHPTHSVAAIGPLARELTEGHELASTPCGEGTPYAALLERDGQVLLLGAGLKSHTSYHTVEAMAELDYLMQKEPGQFTLIDCEGRERVCSIPLHAQHIARRFSQTEEFLMSHGIMVSGRVGAAKAMLISGRPFLEVMIPVLREEPAFLLAEWKQPTTAQ